MEKKFRKLKNRITGPLGIFKIGNFQILKY